MEVIGNIIYLVQPYTLDLSKNNFSDEGFKRIASELQKSTSLVHISLSGNQIT